MFSHPTGRMRRLTACLGLLMLAGSAAGQAPTTASIATQQARTDELRTLLSQSEERLKERTADINARLADNASAIATLDKLGDALLPQQRAQRQKLIEKKTALQNGLTYLQSAVSARKSAVNSQLKEVQFLREQKEFLVRQSLRPHNPGPSEIAWLEAELNRVRSLEQTVERMYTSRAQQLEDVRQKLASAGEDPILQAQEWAFTAQLDSAREGMEARKAERSYYEARLAAMRATGATTTQPASQPTSGPADQSIAENKQKLAELLETQARGARDYAQQQLERINQRIADATQVGTDTARLEDDREYWEHKLNYEDRRLTLVSLEKRVAMEKRELAQLEEGRRADENIWAQQNAGKLSKEERKKHADDYRKQAADAETSAAAISAQASAERLGSDIWAIWMTTVDRLEAALRERVVRELNVSHYTRMLTTLDTERQQINAMMNIAEVVNFALLRRATMARELRDQYARWADELDPPGKTFWERHEKEIHSIQVVLTVVALSYLVRLTFWILLGLIGALGTRFVPGRFSIKRVQTLLSFAGSIIKGFLWVFAIIWVLDIFGIDPARTTGVIGLVGLIMAGMFQQILIDFVKGLDIVAGRHYNVGDFVELDGKTGHVVDFNIKHTRIRTASGQEYNLPNSRCVPSRRFPEGYVDNYVDIVLRSTADVQRAKRVIVRICRHLSRRIEQMKEEASCVDQFAGPRPHSAVLRYRLRVLPGSDWVVTQQFIPDVKGVLADEKIELLEEPSFFFLNRIQTFRQLFSRELTEEEIVREVKDQDLPTAPASAAAAAGEVLVTAEQPVRILGAEPPVPAIDGKHQKVN
jgi:small-conductance mechanosensitive channel